jgi:glycosyltransferase involved in cell wall biosynthesis
MLNISSKISIIIPIYNAESFLVKCLDSVINQSYQNLEIILVNDGSTDQSKELIDAYVKNNSKISAIHKENGGIGSAYKRAFDVMTGDFILFVDSDDWLELNAIEELLKLARFNDADVVSFGIQAVDDFGAELQSPTFMSINQINTTNQAILKTHFEVLKNPTLVRLYKKELFDDIFILEQNIGIDEMLTPQLLLKCNRAVYTSEVYYNVLIRTDSVCRAVYNDVKVLQTIKVYQYLTKFFSANIEKYQDIMYYKYLQILNGMMLGHNKSEYKLAPDNVKLLKQEFKQNFKLYADSKKTQQISKRERISMHLNFNEYLRWLLKLRRSNT